MLIPEKGARFVTPWGIAFFGSLALLIGLPLLFPDPYLEIIGRFPSGALVTFQVTALSIVIATVIGLLTGLGQISRVRLLNLISGVYVEVIRGIPLLCQLFFIYYALGGLLHLQPFVAAVLALSVCYGAYLGEVFRAGIQAVPKGQMEAAQALGLSRYQAMTRIIFPQMIKIVLPAIGNEFIALLKDSTLVSIVAISDLMREARLWVSVTFDYFPAYFLVSIAYLLVTLTLSKLVAYIEARLNTNAR